MTRRITFVLLASLVLVLVAAQGASAASPDTIHKDARDGVINGNYTLQEMRDADRTVSAVQREYYGWEDSYNAYLRHLANPDEPIVAVPIDSNKNGKVDPAEKAAAVTKTKAAAKRSGKRKPVTASSGSGGECEDDDEACQAAATKSEKADKADDEDAGSWLIWLIVGLPILIVALGAARMLRRKRGGGSGGSDTPPRPPFTPEPGSTPGPGQP